MLGLQQLARVSRGPGASATAVPASALSLYLPQAWPSAPYIHVWEFVVLLYRILKGRPGQSPHGLGKLHVLRACLNQEIPSSCQD